MKLAENILEELWFAEDDLDSAAEQASRSFAAKLGELQGLKPFPAVAQKTMSILANSDFRVSQVSRALEEDPSLASSVVRMANSSFFFGSSPCSSIDQAFVRLGAKTVRDVIAAVAVMEIFPDQSGFSGFIRDHCATTAALVQLIARDFAHKHIQGIFLCGLMHDIGKLLLIESGEGDYTGDEMSVAKQPNAHHINERNMIGYDHAVLAGHVVNNWNIPAPIPQVIAWHHQPTRAYEDRGIGPMVAALRVADQLDYHIACPGDNVDAFLEEFADRSDCHYLGITATQLKDRWDTLHQVRADALSFFSA